MWLRSFQAALRPGWLTILYGLLPICKRDIFNRTLLRSVAVVYPALLGDMPPGLHGIRVLGAYRSSGFLAVIVIGFSQYRSDLLRHDCRVSRSQTWLGTRCLNVYKEAQAFIGFKPPALPPSAPRPAGSRRRSRGPAGRRRTRCGPACWPARWRPCCGRRGWPVRPPSVAAASNPCPR